jgi:thiol-disulfide isomerase/thioredoxin
MKNKPYVITALVVAAIVVAGAAGAYANKINTDKKAKEHTAMMMKQEADAKMKQDEAMKHDDAMQKDTQAMAHDSAMANDSMSKSGAYITSDEYAKNKATYADYKKVYFFHASWCPVCQAINKEITADPAKIPAKTVIIKTDFDTSLDLRKTYGVTQQYTFVQFDNSATQLKKWSANNYNDVLAGVL